MRKLTALILVLGASAALAGSSWRVSVDGIGPLHVGMSVQEVARVLGQSIEVPVDEEEAACFYIADANTKGLTYMFTAQRLARIDVDTPGITTLRGAAIGDDIARIRSLYGGRLKEQPHFYEGAPDLYLTFWTRDRRHAVRFETSNGKVKRFYAGKAPEVEFVEGCQ